MLIDPRWLTLSAVQVSREVHNMGQLGNFNNNRVRNQNPGQIIPVEWQIWPISAYLSTIQEICVWVPTGFLLNDGLIGKNYKMNVVGCHLEKFILTLFASGWKYKKTLESWANFRISISVQIAVLPSSSVTEVSIDGFQNFENNLWFQCRHNPMMQTDIDIFFEGNVLSYNMDISSKLIEISMELCMWGINRCPFRLIFYHVESRHARGLRKWNACTAVLLIMLIFSLW